MSTIKSEQIIQQNKELIKTHLHNIQDKVYEEQPLFINLTQDSQNGFLVKGEYQLSNKGKASDLYDSRTNYPETTFKAHTIIPHRRLYAQLDNNDQSLLKVSQAKNDMKPNIIAFYAPLDSQYHLDPLDDVRSENYVDPQSDKKLFIAQAISEDTDKLSHFKNIMQIARYRAANSQSKAFKNTVETLKNNDYVLAGGLLLSGKGPNQEALVDDVYQYVKTGQMDPKMELHQSDINKLQQSVVQDKKMIIRKLSKLITDNILSGGQQTDQVLQFIQNHFGLSTDQLSILSDIKAQETTLNKQEFAQKLLDAIIFFSVSSINPDLLYTQTQKLELVKPDFLNDVLFSDVIKE